MTRRGTLVLALLAVLGVGVAFGIGLAANAISGDRIGLSARPLNAGDALAPARAREPGDDNGGQRGRGSNDATRTTTTPTTTTPTTSTEAGDDHGGRSRGGSGSHGGSGRSRGGSGGGDDSGGGRAGGRGRGGGDD